MKSLNVNRVTDDNLDLLLLFHPFFIGVFGVISILKNVEMRVNNFLIIDAGQFCAILTDSGTFQ